MTTAAAARSFFDAVQSGQVDKVRDLLRDDPSLLQRFDERCFGATPLNLAAGRCDLAMIDALLEHGADPDRASDWWAGPFAPLHSVPRRAIELDRDGLGDATLGGAVSRRLIEGGATVDVHAAAHLGLRQRLVELLDEDPSRLEATGGDGMHPLHFAASVPIAALLLERGADLESRDVDHESTPAQWAAAQRPQVARYLVQRGAAADPFMAGAIGDLALLRRTIEDEPQGVHVRLTDDRFPCRGERAAGHIYLFTIGGNTTLLHVAAGRDLPAATAQHLLAAGADPNARGGYDDGTPLHAAAWNDNAAVAESLLDAGADLEARSGRLHHNTPLGWAIVGGSAGVVDLLLSRGAAVLDFHHSDAEDGAAGRFTCLSAAPLDAWRRIAERLRCSP